MKNLVAIEFINDGFDEMDDSFTFLSKKEVELELNKMKNEGIITGKETVNIDYNYFCGDEYSDYFGISKVSIYYNCEYIESVIGYDNEAYKIENLRIRELVEQIKKRTWVEESEYFTHYLRSNKMTFDMYFEENELFHLAHYSKTMEYYWDESNVWYSKKMNKYIGYRDSGRSGEWYCSDNSWSVDRMVIMSLEEAISWMDENNISNFYIPILRDFNRDINGFIDS